MGPVVVRAPRRRVRQRDGRARGARGRHGARRARRDGRRPDAGPTARAGGGAAAIVEPRPRDPEADPRPVRERRRRRLITPRRRVPGAAAADRAAAARPLRPWRDRRRSIGRGPWRSSGRGGRPQAGRATRGADRRRGRRGSGRRSCRASRSGSTARPTRRRSRAGTPTVAVIGGGHERLYPAAHRGLGRGDRRRRAAPSISEFAPDTIAQPRDVPAPQPDHQRAGRRDGRGRGRCPERCADDGGLGARAGPRLFLVPGPTRRPDRRGQPRVPARGRARGAGRRRDPRAARGPRTSSATTWRCRPGLARPRAGADAPPRRSGSRAGRCTWREPATVERRRRASSSGTVRRRPRSRQGLVLEASAGRRRAITGAAELRGFCREVPAVDSSRSACAGLPPEPGTRDDRMPPVRPPPRAVLSSRPLRRRCVPPPRMPQPPDGAGVRARRPGRPEERHCGSPADVLAAPVAGSWSTRSLARSHGSPDVSPSRRHLCRAGFAVARRPPRPTTAIPPALVRPLPRSRPHRHVTTVSRPAPRSSSTSRAHGRGVRRGGAAGRPPTPRSRSLGPRAARRPSGPSDRWAPGVLHAVTVDAGAERMFGRPLATPPRRAFVTRRRHGVDRRDDHRRRASRARLGVPRRLDRPVDRRAPRRRSASSPRSPAARRRRLSGRGLTSFTFQPASSPRAGHHLSPLARQASSMRRRRR